MMQYAIHKHCSCSQGIALGPTLTVIFINIIISSSSRWLHIRYLKKDVQNDFVLVNFSKET
jgi:hypothetical protein